MDLCRTPVVEGTSLAELQTANTRERLRQVSMAWERELLCRATALQEVPSLPSLLAEEIALPALISAHQEELGALQRGCGSSGPGGAS